ncbi:MAG: thioesterase family protein [Pseudomonadota bacterium]
MQDAAPTPFRTKTQTVLPDWIDYNGHMNVAYYTLAFDRALDDLYEAMDIGPSAVKTRAQGPMALQTQIHYLAELLEGEAFYCDALLVDCDHKRVHCMLTMIAESDGRLAATYETLSINVDLTARRSAPYPSETAVALERLCQAQAALARPVQMGRIIGIRR